MVGNQLHALVIVPDEKNRTELKKGLDAQAGIKWTQEFIRWEEAAPSVKKKAPNVIFADVSIGKKDGLDWLDDVPRAVAVVLLAGHPRLAASAFEKRVVDYLVRPVSPQRLRLTIGRLMEWKALHARHGREAWVDKKIMVHSRREHSVIRPHDIVCIRSEGNYSSLLLRSGERKLVHRSLRHWKKLLPEEAFFQIHRSTLINLNQVNHFERKGKGRCLLRLLDQAEPLPVSRRLAVQLRRRLEAFRRS